jgi:hypothetical protein
MARRFLLASTTSYSEYDYEGFKPEVFSEIFADTLSVNSQQKRFAYWKTFAKLCSKLCRD